MSDEKRQVGKPEASRRAFLKTSTATMLAGGLAANLALSRSAHAAGDDTIRFGLIGCGGRGTGAASQALSTEGSVKLVAMGDAFEDRLESSLENLKKQEGLAARIDVPKERRFIGFDAYKQVLDSGVDLVILATPPGFRPIHLKAAVAAGKNVFMEKPVAVDAPGVRDVLEATAEAKKKGLALSVGLQRHHQPAYIETIKRLQDGMIGDIVATRVYWNGDGVWVRPRQPGQTEMEYQMRNWYYFNWLCGDHINEQHIHNIDVSNWLKGMHPISAEGMGGREVRKGPDNGEIFDHHAVEFEYPDGSRMFSYCRHIPGCWRQVAEFAHGSNGAASISGAEITAGDGSQWKYRAPRGGKQNPYQIEHDDLFAAIRSGNPTNEGEYGATSTMTSILGRMATYSGQMISWEDAINSEIKLGPKRYAWDAEPPVPKVAVPGVTRVL